jgi:hypothetical protein
MSTSENFVWNVAFKWVITKHVDGLNIWVLCVADKFNFEKIKLWIETGVTAGPNKSKNTL